MTFEGNVSEIIFRNEENGYTVARLRTRKGEITFVGFFLVLDEGESIEITGREKNHPIYGQQIEVLSYQLAALEDDKSIFNYLSSGNIDEIGPKMAERIVNHFGDQTLEVFEKNPERLLEIEGIGPKRFNKIIQSYQAQSQQRSILIQLSSYEIPAPLAMKIYKAFGQETIKVLKENPYLLASRIKGLGFLRVDEIAMKMGLAKDSLQRIEEGIKYVLAEDNYQGDSYSTMDKLKVKAMQILGASMDKIDQALYELAIKKDIIIEEGQIEVFGKGMTEERVYLEQIHQCESEIAYLLLKLMAQPQTSQVVQRDAQTMVKEAEDRLGIQLEAMQAEAVTSALDQKVMVLTGGPGTGKTTIISFLISCLEDLGQKVRLCAPTGRAAKRMSETTGREAMTIHRLLEVGYRGEDDDNFYNRDEDNPLETDVIIVDEVSMVDIFLMRALLRAVPLGCSLILVGDKDQLPSVGLGTVLQDIIDSQVIKTVTLSEIFRQSKESSIIVNAHRVNRGEGLEIQKGSQDLFLMQRNNPREAQDLVVELMTQRLPSFYQVDPRDIQVLCPIKKTALGVFELNNRLQDSLNPPEGKKEFKQQDRILREGDKVMQTKNNYEKEYIGQNGAESGKGVFNGDIGNIASIDPVAKEFFILWEDQRISRYAFDEADNIEHAYAMTVHKSQGSEFDIVIIPIMNLPPMMQNRNILYTALTRAKKLVVLVGSAYQIDRMIQNRQTQERNSSLAQRLITMKDMVLENKE